MLSALSATRVRMGAASLSVALRPLPHTLTLLRPLPLPRPHLPSVATATRPIHTIANTRLPLSIPSSQLLLRTPSSPLTQHVRTLTSNTPLQFASASASPSSSSSSKSSFRRWALGLFVLISSTTLGALLSYKILLDHPQEHALSQEAEKRMRADANLWQILYGSIEKKQDTKKQQDGEKNEAAVAAAVDPSMHDPATAPSPLAHVFDSSWSLSAATSLIAGPDDRATADMYIYLPNTNLGHGQMHVHGRVERKKIKREEMAAKLKEEAAAAAAATAAAQAKQTESSLPELPPPPHAAADNTAPPASSSPPSPAADPRSMTTNWILESVVLTFPDARRSFRLDLTTTDPKSADETETKTKWSEAPFVEPRPSPLTLTSVFNRTVESVAPTTWKGVVVYLLGLGAAGWGLRAFLKSIPRRRLTRRVTEVLQNHPAVLTQLGSNVRVKLTNTSYAVRTLPIRRGVSQEPVRQKDFNRLLQTYRISAGTKAATAHVDAIRKGEKEPWRVISANVRVEGRGHQIPVQIRND